jgi:hypothetical protein
MRIGRGSRGGGAGEGTVGPEFVFGLGRKTRGRGKKMWRL